MFASWPGLRTASRQAGSWRMIRARRRRQRASLPLTWRRCGERTPKATQARRAASSRRTTRAHKDVEPLPGFPAGSLTLTLIKRQEGLVGPFPFFPVADRR